MNLSRRAQEYFAANLTAEDALPTRMPLYVNSVAYLFGVAALSAVVMLVLSGLILVLFGPTWYHRSPIGQFFNSLHFWSVQLFFGGLLAHVTTKFFMAAWRDRRWWTWALGALTLGVALAEALLGYMAQSNFDAQWIALQGKDSLNALGVGAFFNALDTSQVLVIHVALLPLLLGVLVGLHLFFIRREGPVKPIERARRPVQPAATGGEVS